MVWIGRADGETPWSPGEAVPLALFEAPCFCRSGAIDSLDAAGTPWRVTFTSPSLYGLLAAVAAGLGVTVRTPLGMPPVLAVVGPRLGLPALGEVDVSLHTAGRELDPAVARFKEIVRDVVEGVLSEMRLARNVA